MSGEYKAYHTGEKTVVEKKRDFLDGISVDIPLRGLSKKTCLAYGYQIGEENGKEVHIASYRSDANRIVGQKIRFKDKRFMFLGENKEGYLYGQWLFEPKEEFEVIITEGEIDALSVFEAFEGKRSVVSIPFGAKNAHETIAKQLEWLLKWKSVILAFDSDEEGSKATEKCLKLIPPNKAKIAKWSRKDANDVLTKDGANDVRKTIWNASSYVPNWIVKSSDLSTEELLQPIPSGINIPFPKLNHMVRGIKPGRLYILAAGSGMGKTTLCREFVYHWLTEGRARIGHVFLEESVNESAQTYIAMDNDIPDYLFIENPGMLDVKKFEASKQRLFGNDNLVFTKHFGSLSGDDLLTKLYYLINAENCNVIVLDHISIAISGTESSSEGERKDIDKLMTKLRSLVEDTRISLVVVSHVKRPGNSNASTNAGTNSSSNNRGRPLELSDLRGSASLEQLSDYVIGLEGNQFDEVNGDLRRLKVLKSRKGGFVGYADTVKWHRDIGRLKPTGG
jgi:twinkle protein